MTKAFASLLRKFSRDPLAQNFLILLLGTVAGQAIPILLSPILTRIFRPEDFGVLGVFSALSMSLVPLATLRYELALLLVRSEEEAAAVFALSALVLCITCTFAFVVIALLPSFAIFGADTLGTMKFWLPLALFVVSFYQVLVYEATRCGRLGVVARTKVVQGLAGPGVQIGLGLTLFQTTGLLLGFIAGQSAGTVSMIRTLVLPRWASFRALTWLQLRQAALRYIRFPLISSWSGVLQEVGSQYIALVLVMIAFGPVVAGYLFLADRVVGRPLLVVTTSTLQAFASEISTLLKSGSEDLIGRFVRVLGVQFALALGWCAVVFFMAPIVVVPLFGPSWAPAVPCIQIMCFVYLFQATMHPLYPTLQLLERQGTLAIWEVLRLAAVSGVILFAARGNYSVEWGLGLYAAAQALAQIALLVIQLRAISTMRRAPQTDERGTPDIPLL